MALRDELQKVLDADDEGWQVGHFCVVMSIDRLYDGDMESAVWYFSPEGQPAWITTALLDAASEERHTADHE